MEFMNDDERWDTMRAPTFKRSLPLEDHPYERPESQIVIEDVVLGTDEMVFMPDDSLVETSAVLSVPGYHAGTPTLTVADWEYREMGVIDIGPTYSSRIVLTIPLNRDGCPTPPRSSFRC